MFMQIWAGLWGPVMAGFAGYLLTHTGTGVTAGVLAYTALVLSLQAARLYARVDYWASKLATLRAEEVALHQALTEESRRVATGTSALAEAYRTQLVLLQVRKAGLRAGYKSDKSAGVLGHFSETKGGLLPDAS